MPDFSQNFNRYSYALNNPLMYVDKNGKFFFMPILVGMAWGALIGAATGGVGGAVGAAIDGKNIGKGLLQGAKNGAIAGGTVAGLNIATMGAAYKPNRTYGDFGKNGPVYRMEC